MEKPKHNVTKYYYFDFLSQLDTQNHLSVLLRCGWSDLRDQQVPYRQTDHQGPVHCGIRWPARCHRLLPWLPVGREALPHERDVPYRYHHRYLLHRLCSGTQFILFWSKTHLNSTLSGQIFFFITALCLVLGNVISVSTLKYTERQVNQSVHQM